LGSKKSLKRISDKPKGLTHRGPLKFRDFENYRKHRNKKSKKDNGKIASRLVKESNTIRGSFDGRKSMNMTKEDNLKMSYDDFPKSRQKDNICLNTQTQKGKSNFKFKPHNSINMSSKVEPQPVDYRSRLSRAQSSKPLRVSLKDLD